MADIFISYSRHDSQYALQLAERLRASGADVWMDSLALAAAETWSAEIVNAINSARLFFILLSPSSVASHNVNKELSLASEKRKTIVPIVIEKCPLSESMEYALAGVQRVSITNEDALERTFAKLGITGSGFSQVVKRSKTRKSSRSQLLRIGLPVVAAFLALAGYVLFAKHREPIRKYGYPVHKVAVLPFENLGSGADEHITDAITTETIHTLAQLFGVSVIDRSAVQQYKSKKVAANAAASELCVEYVVNGTMQHTGNEIRVTIQLTESATGKLILSEHFDGPSENLLNLEERMGLAIAFELQYAIGASTPVVERWPYPSDPEAFRLKDLASRYLDTTRSRAVLDQAQQLLKKALEIEPDYMGAVVGQAKCYLRLYEAVSHDPRDLARGDSLLDLAHKMDTSAHYIHRIYYASAMLHHDLARAEQEVKELVRLEPNDPYSYNSLCGFYLATTNWPILADVSAVIIQRDITNFLGWDNHIFACRMLGDTGRMNKAARQFAPLMQRYLAKNETDFHQRIQLGYYLSLIGRTTEAEAELNKALQYRDKWTEEYYNAGCAYSMTHDVDRAIDLLAEAFVRDRNFVSDGHSLPTYAMNDPDLRFLLAQPHAEERILARMQQLRRGRTQ